MGGGLHELRGGKRTPDRGGLRKAIATHYSRSCDPPTQNLRRSEFSGNNEERTGDMRTQDNKVKDD